MRGCSTPCNDGRRGTAFETPILELRQIRSIAQTGMLRACSEPAGLPAANRRRISTASRRDHRAARRARQAFAIILFIFVPHTGHVPFAIRRPFVSATSPWKSRFSLHFTQYPLNVSAIARSFRRRNGAAITIDHHIADLCPSTGELTGRTTAHRTRAAPHRGVHRAARRLHGFAVAIVMIRAGPGCRGGPPPIAATQQVGSRQTLSGVSRETFAAPHSGTIELTDRPLSDRSGMTVS